MNSYARRAAELKEQQVEETRALRQLQAEQTGRLLGEVRGDAVRIAGARGILSWAGDLEAPRPVVDALCRWIGEMEKS